MSGGGRLPDFLIIGAARSGTTALYSQMRQAPDIFMPALKEPNFFSYEGEALTCQGPGAEYINNSITEADAYKALFAKAPDGAICGEASPLYLYAPRAPERILHHVPKVRMIVVLRNPVEQAFSHFLYATRHRIETETDFLRALDQEEARLRAGWQPLFGYSSFPRYGEQLARYFKLFPRESFLIRRYEAFRDTPDAVLRDALAFVGADPDFQPVQTEGVNAGGTPRNRAFQDFLMRPNPITGAIGLVVPRETRWKIRDWLAGFNTRRGLEMPEAARAILTERLREDVAHLSDVLGEDFSDWLR
ncbi:sulfotransferase [Salipiger sp. PrR002]|uniref:sulfotransferase n=1 Tax=Salipiger sp. PrR002 TaxID=2706489 RepID=UPI0013BA0409|nr:sulfotransferase [Salipiger sp. PrR002]NDV99601.1 sulfotransferase domain-containing protein [Salipiger sp. PrR002]NDW57247.1 sulfotransferase domain-containing protein [Salipiger sp. PrR004]